MTNGDKIRSMSNEELVKLINKSSCIYCNGCNNMYDSCEQAIENWLGSECES